MTTLQMTYAEFLENKRHNNEMERLTGEQQAEIARSNRANEQIRADANNLTARQIAEQSRHNVSTEGISNVSNQIEYIRNQQNYKLASDRLKQDVKRSNFDMRMADKQYGLNAMKTRADVWYQQTMAAINDAAQKTRDRELQAKIRQYNQDLAEKQRQFDMNYDLALQRNDREKLQFALSVWNEGVDTVDKFLGFVEKYIH